MLSFEQWLAENRNASAKLINSAGGDEVKRLLSRRDRAAAEKEIGRLYARLLPVMEKTQRQLDQSINDIAKRLKLRRYRIASRIKPLPSVINKVVQRGAGIETIGDFVAGSIYLDGHDEPERVYKQILRKFGSKVVAHEKKTRGGDPYGYHGAYHVDLIMPTGLQVELQILTKKLQRYKDAAHQIYTRTRGQSKDELDKGELALSRKLFRIGNLPGRLREEIDGIDGLDDTALLEGLVQELLDADLY